MLSPPSQLPSQPPSLFRRVHKVSQEQLTALPLFLSGLAVQAHLPPALGLALALAATALFQLAPALRLVVALGQLAELLAAAVEANRPALALHQAANPRLAQPMLPWSCSPSLALASPVLSSLLSYRHFIPECGLFRGHQGSIVEHVGHGVISLLVLHGRERAWLHGVELSHWLPKVLDCRVGCSGLRLA